MQIEEIKSIKSIWFSTSATYNMKIEFSFSCIALYCMVRKFEECHTCNVVSCSDCTVFFGNNLIYRPDCTVVANGLSYSTATPHLTQAELGNFVQKQWIGIELLAISSFHTSRVAIPPLGKGHPIPYYPNHSMIVLLYKIWYSWAIIHSWLLYQIGKPFPVVTSKLWWLGVSNIVGLYLSIFLEEFLRETQKKWRWKFQFHTVLYSNQILLCFPWCSQEPSRCRVHVLYSTTHAIDTVPNPRVSRTHQRINKQHKLCCVVTTVFWWKLA